MRWAILPALAFLSCAKVENTSKSEPIGGGVVLAPGPSGQPKAPAPEVNPPRFGRGISDDSTHRDVAALLKSKGVVLDVQQENWKSAVFTDPASGGRVAVIKAPSVATAQRAVEEGGKEWVDCYAVGPFFIGAAKHGADVQLCQRIRAVLK